MLYNKPCDVFMLMYCDHDAYLNICIGCPKTMGDQADAIEKIIKKVVIVKEPCNVRNRFFGCTKVEIQETFQKEYEAEARLYFKDHKEELIFAIAFRKRFKVLLYAHKLTNKNEIINRYDYEIYDQSLIRKLENQKPVGQYILYASNHVIISDFKLLLQNKDGRLEEFMINKIAEILPISPYKVGEEPLLCIRFTDHDESMVSISEQYLDEYLCILELLNKSLYPLVKNKVALYYNESQKLNSQEIIFCRKCKKIAYVEYKGSWLKDSYFCCNCGNESGSKNYIIKSKLYFRDSNFKSQLKELSSNGYLKAEESVIKECGLKEYSIDAKDNEDSILFEKVKKYITSMKGQLDYQSAILYRTLLKRFIKQYVHDKQIVNCYDFKLSDSSILLQRLLKLEQIGQYVLINSKEIIVTDFCVYLRGEGRDNVYFLNNIVEIIPIEGISNSERKGICLHTIYDKYIIIEESTLSDISKLLDCINIVLEEGLKYRERNVENKKKRKYFYRTYTNEKDENYIYCPHCDTWTTKMKSSNTCSICELGVSRGYIKKRNNDIDAQRNSFKALFQDQIAKEIKIEMSEDASKDGVVALGIKLQEERDQRKELEKQKKKIERQKKKVEQEEKKKKYAAYIEEKGKEKQRLIEKNMQINPKETWNRLAFSLNFRRRFKMLYKPQDPKNDYRIWKDGYCVENAEIRNLLESAGLIYDYVLYYDGALLLTDRVMYICSLNQGYLLASIQEIVCYKRDKDYKMYIVYDNTKIPVKYSKVGIDVALLINISLDTLRDSLYSTKYDKYAWCCCYCDSDDLKVGMINWYCRSCGEKITSSQIYLNKWNLAVTKSLKEQVSENNIRKYDNSDLYVDEKKDYETYERCMEQVSIQRSITDTNTYTALCPYCGKQIKSTAKFCNFCGQAIEQTSENDSKIFCVYCGKEILKETKFCNYCGKENKNREKK